MENTSRAQPDTLASRRKNAGSLEHQNWLSKIPPKSIQTCHFDDLETAEHTKCKPLSVALAVDPNMRKILRFQVSQMPAKGPLARIARKKYGARKDSRPKGWDRALGDLRLVLSEKVEITSDENPHYPKLIQMHFPHSRHI